MATTLDPFTLVHNAIWDCLENKAFFTDLVKESNSIKLSKGSLRRFEKDSRMESDFPEVMVTSTGGKNWELKASGGASVSKIYSIIVTTGARALDDTFFPLQWAITRAMYDYETKLLALSYGPDENPADELFVKKLSLPETQDGLHEDINKGIVGWSCIWQCEVLMWFTNTILRGE